MNRRTRRRPESAGDAGTDSFLDILANLVGILVILVVVVAVRVRQTVRDVPVAVEPTLPPPAASTPVPRRSTMPIVVDFATPAPVRAANPDPSADVIAEVAELREQLQEAAGRLDAIPVLDTEAAPHAEADALREQAADVRRQTAEVTAVSLARAADVARLRKRVQRIRRELDDAEEPVAAVESLHHEVRPLARAAGRQVYLHLSGGRLTVIPGDELIRRVVERQRRDLRNPRYDGVYSGRVGPVEGVTLSYESRRSGTAMDAIGLGAASQSQYWFDVAADAPAEVVDDAVTAGSHFRRTLAALPADASLSCIVTPDSYAAARRLQKFLLTRPQRLAFLPTPPDSPAMFGSNGVRVMSQ